MKEANLYYGSVLLFGKETEYDSGNCIYLQYREHRCLCEAAGGADQSSGVSAAPGKGSRAFWERDYLPGLDYGGVKGYKAAGKRYQIRAVCAVGMGGTGTQLDEVRQKNNIPKDTTLFTLQGGLERKKLRGIYGFMINVMSKTAGKALSEKQDRTPEEDEMLDMMLHGGSRVSVENLGGVLKWYRSETKW